MTKSIQGSRAYQLIHNDRVLHTSHIAVLRLHDTSPVILHATQYCMYLLQFIIVMTMKHSSLYKHLNYPHRAKPFSYRQYATVHLHYRYSIPVSHQLSMFYIIPQHLLNTSTSLPNHHISYVLISSLHHHTSLNATPPHTNPLAHVSYLYTARFCPNM